MAIIREKVSTASMHWYDVDGNPRHFVPNMSKGGTRPTTIKDAKKLGLFPSITSIIGILEKQQLKNWQFNQIALASIRAPKQPDETEEYYCQRIQDEAFAQVQDAADLGTRIHASIDAALEEPDKVDPEMVPYVQPAMDWLRNEAEIEPIEREVSLVSRQYGYAGTVDFVGWAKNRTPVVLDWKTRKTQPGKPVKPFDGQMMQIAGYGFCYWGEDTPFFGANVVISTTEPGRVEILRYTPAELKESMEAFKHLCCVWRHMKGYDPRLPGESTEVSANG
jgi:hypothetical protein